MIQKTKTNIRINFSHSAETTDNIRTEVYQGHFRHKLFADPLNIVCILKKHLLTEQKLRVFVF